MSDDPRQDHAATETARPGDSSAKAPWHPPTLEEVDYSATEASGAGGVYDFTVYSGSS
jgi:hypothetical protein